VTAGPFGIDPRSVLRKYLAGWGFRSATPAFEPGDEIELFLTGLSGGRPVARVGDTVLAVPDADPDLVDSRVRLRVREFDPERHEGVATYLETVGESAF
jgi:hypothetical protein